MNGVEYHPNRSGGVGMSQGRFYHSDFDFENLAASMNFAVLIRIFF